VNKTAFAILLTIVFTMAAATLSWAQQTEAKPAQTPEGQPPVKMNMLNVCTPSAEEQAEIKSAFAKASAAKLVFSRDFEISRGRTTVKDSPESKFVRLRRDMMPDSPLLATQYSMSTDAASTVELLVLRSRDAKDFHEISLEDRMSAGAASPLAVLSVDTPVSRIRVERIGKRSVVLARCPDADQGAYEPLFSKASDLMASYRKALGLRSAFRMDIGWLSEEEATKPKSAATAPKKSSK
jgi:hypothetical protein